MSSASSSEASAIIQYERGVSIERTERGLVLLMLGILVSAVPIIRPVGILIALAGTILYLLGRDPFGGKNSDYVVAAAALFVVGLSFVLVGSIGYLLFVLSVPGSFLAGYYDGNNFFAWALVPSLKLILAIEGLGAIAIGMAFALFTFSLQKPAVRAALLFAFATNVVVSILVFLVLSSDVTSPLLSGSSDLLSAYSRGGFDPDVAHAFENQVLIVSLLNLIPAVIYVSAYYSFYSRIYRGEVIPLRL